MLIKFFRRRPVQEPPSQTDPVELIESLQEGEKLVFFGGVRMHCEGCRALIDEELQEIEGVLRFDADIKGQSVGVVFDPVCTEPGLISAAIERAGYKPQVARLFER